MANPPIAGIIYHRTSSDWVAVGRPSLNGTIIVVVPLPTSISLATSPTLATQG